MEKYSLTICTVSYKSKAWIELNYRLVRRLDPQAAVSWMVVENTPAGEGERFGSRDRRFTVLQGSDLPGVRPSSRGSYQHALGLQQALVHVNSRYVLFLDPDFFVIMPKWIEKMVTHMQANSLDFFGAPYYPDRPEKYRYFPCGIFLCVDLSRVEKQSLDFTPRSDEIADIWSLSLWRIISKIPRRAADSAVYRMVVKNKLLGWFLWQRFSLLSRGRSFDVGYRIYARYGQDKRCVFESLVPSWENPLYLSSGSLVQRAVRTIARFIFPDEWLIYPQRKEYATSLRFRHYGLPDVRSMGYEEYFWYNKPFGFHVQGAFQGKKRVSAASMGNIVERCSFYV